MKKSVSFKYFMICSVCVIVSILVLGIVFITFSTEYFERQEYDRMQHNVDFATKITAKNYEDNNFQWLDEYAIKNAYGILSVTTNADFFLVDSLGAIIYHSAPYTLTYGMDTIIPPEILEKALTVGYENTGILDGINSTAAYLVARPVSIAGEPIATVFAVSPADNLQHFLGEVLKIFLISAGIVLIVAFISIYYFTSKMVKPLKHMVEATKSFSEGDFSKRIPVTSSDEIGQLAMSFNDMASILAVNENSRRSFIANVSHELKTPMTTIGGFVDGILDGTIPKEKENYYLKIVSSEVDRLGRMVHSMLDTARIEAGEMQLDETVFDISELVRQSIFSFEQSVEEKQLTMAGLEVDKILVKADKDLMHQVVYNLIENAVKFVNVGGEISVSYEKKGNMLYTTIRNTGDGLSKEEATQIFERFYKSDRSRTGHRGGVGLGLHIVKNIIQYHNGTLEADSVPGKYTEFIFGIQSAVEKNGKATIDLDHI